MVKNAFKITAHIALPSNLQTLIDSLGGPDHFPLGKINVPFVLSQKIWDWACAMEAEYKEAAKKMPGSAKCLHAILLPKTLDPTLSNEFMDILIPFKDVTELRKHLRLTKKGSTSGPLGITVEHLLRASDETLGAFLLMTHAAFAGIHAAEAVIGEIRPPPQIR
jgi:hypothetical protein